MDEIALVDSTERLDNLISKIGQQPILAVDTEFLRERTFFPELCLLQIAADEMIGCIDCRAQLPLNELSAAITAPGQTWVLHSSRQDLEILVQAQIGLPGELIDTQLAAALLGWAPQVGYAQLVEEVLGIQLDKAHTRTDWRRRPIPRAAIAYAVDDVRYLLPLWQRLRGMLAECNRIAWLTEDCAALLESYRRGNDERRWERVKGVRSLDQQSQSVARELSAWREQQAARINRPRRWLLSDETLIALARGQPTTPDELTASYNLASKFCRRHGPRLLEAIAAGRSNAPQHQPLSSAPLSRAERTKLKALAQATRRRAEELGVATEVLATRQELTDWICGTASGRLARGWRAELIKALNY